MQYADANAGTKTNLQSSMSKTYNEIGFSGWRRKHTPSTTNKQTNKGTHTHKPQTERNNKQDTV